MTLVILLTSVRTYQGLSKAEQAREIGEISSLYGGSTKNFMPRSLSKLFSSCFSLITHFSREYFLSSSLTIVSRRARRSIATMKPGDGEDATKKTKFDVEDPLVF